MKVLQFPLTKITLVFLQGILTAFYFHPNPNHVFGSLLFLIVVLMLFFFGFQKSKHNRLYLGILIYCISYCIGMSSLMIQTHSLDKNNFSNDSTIFEKELPITILIREKLKNTQYNQRYVAVVQTINNKNYNGRVLLNIPKNSVTTPIEIGTILRMQGTLIKNQQPDNPNQFDYGKYLNQKQIYAQLYVVSETIERSVLPHKNIWYYSAKITSKITQTLKKSDFNETALAVATALILGQRQDLSPEIVQDYQYAGAVHILSVSGLHVGFIFLFLNFLLKPIPNTRKGAFVKLSVLLISLFLFAVIAGLSPSIVRSVTMFSFVTIGYYLRRSVTIYHTLLVSMLLILLFQAYFLFDVGFQLSYLAVFFIVWFQPILSQLWKPKNKTLRYGWDILTVSFAAQIGTLPLSLYYFHQFPGLFFITNLAVIPLVSIIMFIGIIVTGAAAFGFTALWLSKPLEWSILLLNKIINSIASFEQFIIKDIPFNCGLLTLSYVLIIALILWFKKTNFSRLAVVLTAIIALQLTVLIGHWQTQNQEEWIIFNVKRKTVIATRHGNEVNLYSNDPSIQKSKMLQTYLLANFSQIHHQEPLKHVAFFKGNKILILDSLGIFPKNIKPDIVLLTQSPRINLDRMLVSLKPKLVIADGSNYTSVVKRWEKSCEKQKIPFHATAEKGFFQLN